MPKWLMDFGLACWTTLREMSPYLLFGFLVAGILAVLIPPALVEKHLGGRGIWPVVKASLFGVPLPLCSCGVIPVAASLRKHGASRGATVAFLLSTPQTGVDSIIVTLIMLGPVFAIFRPLAAFVSGLVGGIAVDAASRRDTGAAGEREVCQESCCNGEHEKRPPAWYRLLHHGFVVLPRDIGLALLGGVLVAGLISAFVPADFFAGTLVGSGIVGMLIMMALGIPMYVCATASVPIAAAMIDKGVSGGAALVFLMTGPATNAASLAVMWKMLGRGRTVLTLLSLAVTALAMGLLLDALFVATGAAPGHCLDHMLPGWISTASAVMLIGLVIATKFGGRRRPKAACCDEQKDKACCGGH